MVRNNADINKPEDFHGKRVASPQLGNTQDVALRAWLKAHGMKPKDKGGDVQVLPMANPDQLTLFLKQESGRCVGTGALGHAIDSGRQRPTVSR